MKNLKIGRRITLGFSAVILIVVGLGAITFTRLAAINGQADRIALDALPGLYRTAQWKISAAGSKPLILEHLMADTLVKKAAIEVIQKENSRHTDEIFKEVEETMTSPDGKALLAAVNAPRDQFRNIRNNVVLALSHELKTEAALEAYKNQLEPAFDKYMDAVEAVVKFNQVNGDVASHAIKAAVGGAKLGLAVGFSLALVGAILIGYVVSRSITRPLGQAVKVIERVAQEDLSATLKIDSKDEIGQMGVALNGMVAQFQRIVGVIEKVGHGDLTTKLAAPAGAELGLVSASVNQMVDNLRHTIAAVNQTSEALAKSAGNVSDAGAQVSSTAEETSRQSTVVAAAAEQVSRSIQTVASSSEEMTICVNEISKNATEASRVAAHAASVAEQTNLTVAKLGESSVEIGNVIKVITSIAEQTNLLALNATIEAARAGEAGKGFAVVANEVKELAKQTARATEDISKKISTVQADTQGAVSAIKEIGGIIAQINEIQTVIAGAVEEQAATTREISKSASEAAQGGTEIAQNIGSVSEAAKNTATGAENTVAAGTELTRLSAELQSVLQQFSTRDDGLETATAPASFAERLPSGDAATGRVNGSGARQAFKSRSVLRPAHARA